MNAFPQFTTTVDGVDIHFIQVRSRHKNALPLIITHGWPGSIFEQIKIIGPLTDPTASGGRAEDAFDVVIPSLPGYGFSSRPTETGWDVERIGRAWDVLMKRLGYTRYVSQGGDWGHKLRFDGGLDSTDGPPTGRPAVLPRTVTVATPAFGRCAHLLQPTDRPHAGRQRHNVGEVTIRIRERRAFERRVRAPLSADRVDGFEARPEFSSYPAST